jgi:hypothetical protein
MTICVCGCDEEWLRTWLASGGDDIVRSVSLDCPEQGVTYVEPEQEEQCEDA